VPNLPTLHPFVEAERIEQDGLQSGTFGANDINAVNITNIERVTGLALGADDYITKPFSTKAVIERVESILGGSQKTSEKEA